MNRESNTVNKHIEGKSRSLATARNVLAGWLALFFVFVRSQVEISTPETGYSE
jgi:hypothetical protein